MARSRGELPNPQPQELIEHRDEANLGPLGLICVQERIPDSFTTWETPFLWGDGEGVMSCLCASELGGVPHGMDGDFATILNILYLEQGMPSDGWVHTTAYHLIRRAGFETSGHYYARLDASLKRLKGAQFELTRLWRVKGRGRTDSLHFSYIKEFVRSTLEDSLGEETTLSIQLARPITTSISDQYLRPLDLPFLVSLHRPLTRALYRLLSAMRERTEAQRYYEVDAQSWARACKVSTSRVDTLKRMLEGAHAELVERGYLQNVQWLGRGSKARVGYTYAQVRSPTRDALPQGDPAPPDTPLKQAVSPVSAEQRRVDQSLERFGVPRPTRERLLKQYPPPTLEDTLHQFEDMLKAGYTPRSPAALLSDMLKHPDKYEVAQEPLLAGAALKVSRAASRACASPASTTAAQHGVNPRPEPPEPPRTPEQETQDLLFSLKMLPRHSLTATQFEHLEGCLKRGQLDAPSTRKRLIAAMTRLETKAFIAELLEQIGPPEAVSR